MSARIKTTLVIVDMQRAVELDGTPARDLELVTKNLNQVAASFRSMGRAVVFLRHEEPEGLWNREAAGWPLLPGLSRDPGDLIVDKRSCDGFRQTELAAVLAQRDTTALVIGGYATEFCVDSTIRSAASRGLSVTVLADAHTTRDRPYADAMTIIAHQNWVWREISNPGAPIAILSTDAVVA